MFHFSLRFVKSCFRGAKSNHRFNAPVLNFVHDDVDLDIGTVTDIIGLFQKTPEDCDFPQSVKS